VKSKLLSVTARGHPARSCRSSADVVALSERVRRGELFAYVVIDESAVETGQGIAYHFNSPTYMDLSRWLCGVMTHRLQEHVRERLGISVEDRAKLNMRACSGVRTFVSGTAIQQNLAGPMWIEIANNPGQGRLAAATETDQSDSGSRLDDSMRKVVPPLHVCNPG